jgi:hypothetical protein
VSAARGQPGAHRQHWLGAVQRLRLALLVHAQHDGLLRGMQVQPDDVPQLGLELGVLGALAGTKQPRLEAPLLPPAGDGGVVHADVAGQQS